MAYLRGHNDRCKDLQERAANLGVRYLELRSRGAWDIALSRRVRKLAIKRNVDIIHAHEYKSNLLAMLVAKKVRCHCMSTAHGWTGHKLRERLIYYPGDRWILRKYRLVVSVSSEITRTLVRAGAKPHRIRTIPNAIDPEQFRPEPTRKHPDRASLGLAHDDFVIGAVGRLERQKRFDLLIDAFARLQGEGPRRVLCIAGDGPLRHELLSQVERLGISDRCRFLGHVKDVRRFYPALDVFVQSSEYEGTPNVVLEAMAMGIPVVATDAGGTRDVLRDRVDGLVVSCCDSGALASGINETQKCPATTQKRVETARLRIESDLSFRARNQRLETVYRSLVSS